MKRLCCIATLWPIMALIVATAAAEPPCNCGQQPLAIPSSSPIAAGPIATCERASVLSLVSAEEQAAQRDLAKESEPYERVRALLPSRFVELQTRRFVILSDASPQWTRAQAERLERAHHQFMRFCSRLGLDPRPLNHKLVCVLFERREDYRAFAASHDNVHDGWVAGYYSPHHDRIVFYNVESPLNQAHPHDRNAAHVQTSIATTIHEAIHQLAFHTRIQSPYVRNPLWLSEGLATAFETDAPGRAFGPDHEYAPRRKAFDDLLERGALIPLRELVTITSLAGENESRVHGFYQQSYALMTWMSRFRRAELRQYLDLLRMEEPGEIASDRLLELFIQAFGEVDQVEQAWLRHEN